MNLCLVSQILCHCLAGCRHYAFSVVSVLCSMQSGPCFPEWPEVLHLAVASGTVLWLKSASPFFYDAAS